MSAKSARRARQAAQQSARVEETPVLRVRSEPHAVLVEKLGRTTVQRLARIAKASDEIARLEHERDELVRKVRADKTPWRYVANATNMSVEGARGKYRGAP